MQWIRDELIRAGVAAAVTQTLEPAITRDVYPGHFTVTADGHHFGGDTTWPGLDSWELAGAYLRLGRAELVRNYFAFVRASQRADGNIPFAIFAADPPPARDTHLRGLKYPADVYTDPVTNRQWIGLFHHWQTQANPLSVLGPISYVLTAAEIAAANPPGDWLRENLASIAQAGAYVASRQAANGLIGGAGFYVECPPRHQWDGITQCYAAHAFRLLGELCARAGDPAGQTRWQAAGDRLARRFRELFWRGDHFAEYIHPERGVVDTHGLSEVNWAAIALDAATAEQQALLAERLLGEPAFWQGGLPTQLVTQPFRYEPWELPEPLPFALANPLHDVAAMGRVWHLEARACFQLGATDRLVESVRRVCAMGQAHDWYWYERYHVQPDGSVKPAGPRGYCEYAAILVRVVLGHPALFGE